MKLNVAIFSIWLSAGMGNGAECDGIGIGYSSDTL